MQAKRKWVDKSIINLAIIIVPIALQYFACETWRFKFAKKIFFIQQISWFCYGFIDYLASSQVVRYEPYVVLPI